MDKRIPTRTQVRFGSIRSTIGAGMQLRLNYGKGNPNNRLIHTLAVVDDHIVFKQWSRRKQRFIYAVEPPEFFYVNREHIERIA
jgi:hypothetical protein